MADEIPQSRRYHAAVALLDDCAALSRLAHTARTVTASEKPYAVTLAGGRRLRAVRRVGVFAGSFNPLTRAHVAMANAALRSAGLDAMIWTCAVASVDKERVERAALVDRLAQMRIFVSGRSHDALALLNRGLYVDEARTMRTLLAPSAELVLLVGFDKIVQIFDPKYYTDRDAALRSLFSLASLLVAPRAGDGAEALAALLAQPENRPFAAQVRYLDVPAHYASDSSTEARTFAAQTPPDVAAISRLLPPAGAALTLHTGAFQPIDGGVSDLYGARECWLDALAILPQAAARRLPPLSALARLTLAEDTRGYGLRMWLSRVRDERRGGRRNEVIVLLNLLRGQASG